jgi:L-fuculose-phosphate aldolase
MHKADLRDLKVITGKDLEAAVSAGAKEVILRPKVVMTPSAKDVIKSNGLLVIEDYGGGSAPSAPSAAVAGSGSYDAIFHSAEALAIKEEIVKVGSKLWLRQYVDGNGGNISYRLRDNLVICTPTLCSKGDLTVDDLCLVDLEGKQLAGTRPKTSEILMHLEIYKSVPQAKAVVHAHPPHATAYAITGRVPPPCIIPEQEVLVGSVAISPYETPGTQAFAETVVPYAKDHNTILLANHGVVCWADTLTHAEWNLEVIDTYCRTLMLASQLGAPVTRIPENKAADLLEIKKRMGLPDARLEMKECQLCDQPEFPGGITLCPKDCPNNCGDKKGTCLRKDPEVEVLIQTITDEVMRALKSKN